MKYLSVAIFVAILLPWPLFATNYFHQCTGARGMKLTLLEGKNHKVHAMRLWYPNGEEKTVSQKEYIDITLVNKNTYDVFAYEKVENIFLSWQFFMKRPPHGEGSYKYQTTLIANHPYENQLFLYVMVCHVVERCKI